MQYYKLQSKKIQHYLWLGINSDLLKTIIRDACIDYKFVFQGNGVCEYHLRFFRDIIPPVYQVNSFTYFLWRWEIVLGRDSFLFLSCWFGWNVWKYFSMTSLWTSHEWKINFFIITVRAKYIELWMSRLGVAPEKVLWRFHWKGEKLDWSVKDWCFSSLGSIHYYSKPCDHEKLNRHTTLSITRNSITRSITRPGAKH